MNHIRELVVERCMEQGIEKIVRSLGYTNVIKGKERLERILLLPDLGLSVPEYDNYFSSRGFVGKLFSVLGLLNTVGYGEIQEILLDIEDKKFGFHPWVFVETCFKRKNESIVALSCLESRRRIALPHMIKKLQREEQLNLLKEWVVAFLKSLDDESGRLVIWGVPKKFVCHLNEAEVLTLDLKGSIIAESYSSINHGGACISLR